MPEKTDHNPSDPLLINPQASVEENNESPQPDAVTTAQMDKLSIEKLNLEIQNLRIKNKWESGPSRYLTAMTALVSIVTALVSVAGFWLSQHKLLADREQDRTDRAQAEQRADENAFHAEFNQLLEFTTSDISKVPILKVNVLLQELDSLAERLGSDKREEVTNLLVDFLSSDKADFGNENCTEFEDIALLRWTAYRNLLKKDSDRNMVITYKYLKTISELHDKDPAFIEKLEYGNGDYTWTYSESDATSSKQESEILTKLSTCVRELKTHLGLMEDHSAEQQRIIDGFMYATNSKKLTEQLFHSTIVK